MPEPIKPALWGVQSLLKFPDARVMLVQGKDNFEAASRVFPANPVLGWEGTLGDHFLGNLSGKNAIVWLANPTPQNTRKIEPIAGAEIHVFAPDNIMECWPVVDVERRRLSRQWILSQLKPVQNALAEPVAHVNGHAAVMVPIEQETRPAASEEAGAMRLPKAKRAKRERTEGTSWSDFGLVLTDKGIPATTLDNCVHVIEQHPDLQGQIWFDTFLQKILHTWGVDVPAEWSDYDDVRLALFLQRDIGIPKVSKGLAGDAVLVYSHRELRNCAYDWLDSLSWDNQPRLMDLATRGFGADDNEYTRQVCRNLILSMVKRVFEPGCKSDYMPIFEGDEGKGKSQALEILGSPWFAELHMDWNGKDFYDALQGKMLIEIGELHAFKQSEISKIDAVVSCRVDRYRPSYGRHTQDFRRQCVFAGTYNPRPDGGWNRSDKGARRFWPIVCHSIDLQWIRDNREQLFAEAVTVIRAGGKHWEVPWSMAQAEQDDRRPPDTWEDGVRQWLIGKSEVTMRETLEDAAGIELGKQSLSDQQRMGRVLKKVGWLKRNRRAGGTVLKIWVNPLTPDSESLFED